jgi:ABC-type polysaccharide/polyol phosphate transport system ATPase subunit
LIGAIRLEGVGKRFRLFQDRPRSFKEAITLGRRRTYEEFWALRDVSFEVAPGEVIGIIGANGSGKSTLLKCLARILRPDCGSIAVGGRLGALLELGAGFHPEMTGRENVFLNGAILGVNRRELKERFDEIVALAALERFIDTPVKNYSSGMYARLGFAIAVSLRSDILLVDEVLAVGDAVFQQRSMAKFEELRQRGCTLVLVTHALNVVEELCDRAVLLREGRLADIGPAPRVVSSYRQALAPAQPVPPPPAEAPALPRGIEVTAVTFQGAGPGKSVITGQPMEVAIDWMAPDAARDLEIDVAILTGNGAVPVAESAAVPSDGSPALLNRGRTRLRLPEVLLAPGQYVVSVAVRTGDREAGAEPSRYPLRIEPGQPRSG